jgi:hypothetical protein
MTPTVARPAPAQSEHLAEQVAERPLVTLDEARDRRVIRPLLGSDHATRDVLDTGALNRPRRPGCS